MNCGLVQSPTLVTYGNLVSDAGFTSPMNYERNWNRNQRNAYRCYDPKSQRYYKSPHVIFDETLHKIVEVPLPSSAGGVKLLESDFNQALDNSAPDADDDYGADEYVLNHLPPEIVDPPRLENLDERDEPANGATEDQGTGDGPGAVADEENQANEPEPVPRAPRRRKDYGPPSRKSRRNEGLEAEHFVPLEGAPVSQPTQASELDSDNESELSDSR
ncbi:hypothetical protein SISSUDRAFT_1038286 [Sistotremastrum suecicum HHB10207 ss-3]|uniref:Retroviral polymerase SH3-like domain-containing protein n=1 Tax=Sistotremastrum suecicum HHB10207 ss-3 TaxID=1314776 RepID=A0A165WYS9_9AGAM|nr:hypothetical protein SISSUDRAFT_1038286 [Sistotremastrum suecicum HHB10207 ss-3]